MQRAPETQTMTVVLLTGLMGCEAPDTDRDAFLFEADRVREIATIQGAQVRDVLAVAKGPLRIDQDWTLALPSTWSHFEPRITEALSWTYTCTSMGTNVQCTRAIPGDRFLLRLTPVGDAGTRRVAVRLTATPD